MRKAGALLDAYAHHPYPSTSRESPFPVGACKYCSTITMGTLERLLTEVGRAFGPKRIWSTEYGYQTGAYGVTQQRQAELIGQAGMRVYKAPRVDMLIHYLVKDEPGSGALPERVVPELGKGRRSRRRWPSRSRSRRPAAAAATSFSGARSVPARGAQTFRVQVRGRARLALQRGVSQDERTRFQHRGPGAGRGQRADLLPDDAAYSITIRAR